MKMATQLSGKRSTKGGCSPRLSQDHGGMRILQAGWLNGSLLCHLHLLAMHGGYRLIKAYSYEGVAI